MTLELSIYLTLSSPSSSLKSVEPSSWDKPQSMLTNSVFLFWIACSNYESKALYFASFQSEPHNNCKNLNLALTSSAQVWKSFSLAMSRGVLLSLFSIWGLAPLPRSSFMARFFCAHMWSAVLPSLVCLSRLELKSHWKTLN